MTRDDDYTLPPTPLTAAERAAYSARVWAEFESDPSFNTLMRAAEVDFAAGRVVPFSTIRSKVRPSRRSRLVAWLRRVVG